MRLLVCGSRDWDDKEMLVQKLNAVRITLRALYDDDSLTLVHGAARGADRLAEEWAEERGIKPEPYPISKDDWDKYGLGAGGRRNQQMLDTGIDYVMAFKDGLHPTLAKGGTEDMLKRSIKARVEVDVCSHDPVDTSKWPWPDSEETEGMWQLQIPALLHMDKTAQAAADLEILLNDWRDLVGIGYSEGLGGEQDVEDVWLAITRLCDELGAKLPEMDPWVPGPWEGK